MIFFRKLFIFAVVMPVSFFAANNFEENDLRTRYNLTTQEPIACQLAALSHLPQDELRAIVRELEKMHQEKGMPYLLNVKALNKDGKSAYDIAKEKYDETRSFYCVMFIDTLTKIEKSIEEINKEHETKEHQNQEFIALGIEVALCGLFVLFIACIIKWMIP